VLELLKKEVDRVLNQLHGKKEGYSSDNAKKEGANGETVAEGGKRILKESA